MATYLLTVQSVDRDGIGIRLSPGIRLSESTGRPAINRMMQGSRLELRRSDGCVSQTRLVTYGVSVLRGEDGSLYMNDDPKDPEIRLTLPVEIAEENLAPGTEVWLLDKDSA